MGRTLVVPNFIEASRLLARAFPGDLRPGPAVPADLTIGARAALGGRGAWNRSVHPDPPHEIATWTAGHRTKRKLVPSSYMYPRATPAHASRARSNAFMPNGFADGLVDRPIDFARLDSIQILENWEFYSSEPRHELIMLRQREADSLTHRSAGIRCGRSGGHAGGPGLLRRCAPDSEALKRASTCGDHRGVSRRMLQRHGLHLRRHCARDVPPCYRNGTRPGARSSTSAWLCARSRRPAAAQPQAAASSTLHVIAMTGP